MYIIENEFLRVEINPSGAELQSVIDKKNKIELLWNGDPAFWSRRAPLLFPIVGKLRGNTMNYLGKQYQMSQHGLVRDMAFLPKAMTEKSIALSCTSNSETSLVYPFEWKLVCKYELENHQLKVSTIVTNTSVHDDMYFSIGYHPAFKVPIDDKLNFEDYYLEFNGDMDAMKWKIVDALIDKPDGQGLYNSKIPITKETFLHDALVFKGLKSNVVTLRSDKSDILLKFTFDNYPYLGIWSKPGAGFVCIEPWHGIADSTDHDGDFTQKEGILKLEHSSSFECGYTIEIS